MSKYSYQKDLHEAALMRWKPIVEKLHSLDEEIKKIWKTSPNKVLEKLIFTHIIGHVAPFPSCVITTRSMYEILDVDKNISSLTTFSNVIKNELFGITHLEVRNTIKKLNDFFIEIGLCDMRRSMTYNSLKVDIQRYKRGLNCINREGKKLQELSLDIKDFEKEVNRHSLILWELNIKRTRTGFLFEKLNSHKVAKLMHTSRHHAINKHSADKDKTELGNIYKDYFTELEKLQQKIQNLLLQVGAIPSDTTPMSIHRTKLFLTKIIEIIDEEIALTIELNNYGNFDTSSFEDLGFTMPPQSMWDEEVNFLLTQIKDKLKNYGIEVDDNLQVLVEITNELSAINLEKLDDLVKPEDYSFPYIQAFHLLSAASNSNKSLIKIRGIFFDFLKSLNLDAKCTLREIFSDNYISIRFKEWLKNNCVETQRIKQKTAQRHVANFNLMITFLKGIEPELFKHIESSYGEFEDNFNRGTAHRPFSQQEREKLNTAICAEIEWSKEVAKPYVPLQDGEKLGTDPFIKNNAGIRLSPKCEINLNTLKWVYEESLHGKYTPPLQGADFFKSLGKYNSKGLPLYLHGATRKFVKEYIENYCPVKVHGVHRIAFDDLHVSTVWNIRRQLLPFILRILQITGLNPAPLSGLKNDSLEEKDHISRQPVLRYWKNRSTGGKRLHLPLVNSTFTQLNSGVYSELRDCFDNIIRITKPYRYLASTEYQDTLILLPKMNNAGKFLGVYTFVEALESSIFENLLATLVKRYRLENDKGEELAVAIPRFRPTLVSQMLKSGSSIRIISQTLGHAELRTTYRYLDSHDLLGFMNKKIEEALKSIHKKSFKEKEEIPTVITTPVEVMMPMATCDCKNPYNPPDKIKNSTGFVEGQRCTQYNKCFFCGQAVIGEQHLPAIFQIQIKYERTLIEIQGSPLAETIKFELEFLEKEITGKTSPFGKEVLRRAREQAEMELEESDCSSFFGR